MWPDSNRQIPKLRAKVPKTRSCLGSKDGVKAMEKTTANVFEKTTKEGEMNYNTITLSFLLTLTGLPLVILIKISIVQKQV